jgi:hypothetical protein
MSRRQAQNYLQEACEEIPKLQPGELNNGVVEWCHIPGRAVGGKLLNDDTWDKQLEPAIRRNPHHDQKMIDRGKDSYEAGTLNPLEEIIEVVCFADFRAYMPQHNYIYIPTREPGSSVNARLGKVKLSEDVSISASTWLDQNRPIEQMTWAPGRGLLIQDAIISEGGWIEKPGITCFNLYREPTIKPGDSAKASPWLDHVHKVFGDDDAEHIVKWCAQRVQHPETKINHALVLGSEQHGVGKDAMLYPVQYAVGPWNFKNANPQQALRRFNPFLKAVILRISEARDLGELSRYQFYDHTKDMAASPPEQLLVDEKFLREYYILNCVGLLITTNHLTDGLYLPAEDRRHYVAWSNLTPGDFADQYWDNLFAWYENGGNGHVAAYLQTLDISGFDPKKPPPKTQAFWNIVDANRSPEDSDLADVLDLLGNPEATTLQVVIDKADRRFAEWLMDHKNRRNIPRRFGDCGYVVVRNPDRNDGFWRIKDRRQVVYALRELSVQDQLRAVQELK